MFVIVALIDGAESRPAQTGVFQEFEAQQERVHFVERDVSKKEAIAAVKAGKSEKRATITGA